MKKSNPGGAMNLSTLQGKSSPFRGVTLFRPTNKWRAQISANGKTTSLGDHDTEEQAAVAFDRACINKSGREARTNFPISRYEEEIEDLQAMSHIELVGMLRSKARKTGIQTSHYRGVSLLKQTSKWHAQINVGGRQLHLGFFNTEEAAARAYDRAAINKGAQEGTGKIVTNYDLLEYVEELDLLRQISQEDLVEALADEGKRKAAIAVLSEGKAEGKLGGNFSAKTKLERDRAAMAALSLKAERAAPKSTLRKPLYTDFGKKKGAPPAESPGASRQSKNARYKFKTLVSEAGPSLPESLAGPMPTSKGKSELESNPGIAAAITRQPKAARRSAVTTPDSGPKTPGNPESRGSMRTLFSKIESPSKTRTGEPSLETLAKKSKRLKNSSDIVTTKQMTTGKQSAMVTPADRKSHAKSAISGEKLRQAGEMKESEYNKRYGKPEKLAKPMQLGENPANDNEQGLQGNLSPGRVTCNPKDLYGASAFARYAKFLDPRGLEHDAPRWLSRVTGQKPTVSPIDTRPGNLDMPVYIEPSKSGKKHSKPDEILIGAGSAAMEVPPTPTPKRQRTAMRRVDRQHPPPGRLVSLKDKLHEREAQDGRQQELQLNGENRKPLDAQQEAMISSIIHHVTGRPLTKRQESLASRKQEEAAATLAAARQSPRPIGAGSALMDFAEVAALAELEDEDDNEDRESLQEVPQDATPEFRGFPLPARCLTPIMHPRLQSSDLAISESIEAVSGESIEAVSGLVTVPPISISNAPRAAAKTLQISRPSHW